MRQNARIRIRIITGFILLLAVILIVRLYYVQIILHADYYQQAKNQYINSVQDLYSRGNIYFSKRDGGTVSAATVQFGYLLAINPSKITDKKKTFESINSVFPIDEENFLFRAGMKDRVYFEIASELSDEQASKIAELNLVGVHLYRDRWRYYPGGELSARTIGFVGYTADLGTKLTGRYGLERYYENILARDGNRLSVNFFAEIFSNLGNQILNTTSARTGDIVTTIEPTVSRVLDRELLNIQETWGSKLTGGIIINPNTGAVYAMNAVPTFDLNDRSGVDIYDFLNPLVENVYEMGSIIKALTIAAGIDSGAITPETTYYDKGFLNIDTFTIGNFDGIGRGMVDMQEVLSQSLNTGVVFIMKTMGKNVFREYFQALQIGNRTGIDLPNETSGLVENLNSPRDIEYATASFGQGIALTPIATVRALSSLANGGVLITPHLVKRIEYQDGTSKEITHPAGERVFSEETSVTISRMLTNVVDNALRHGTVKLENYSVAAKTGTAQIADSVYGGYYEDRHLHSFFGYFPSFDPKFLVFLYTVEPQNARFASETLTDSFMEITTFLINYYNIPPDR